MVRAVVICSETDDMAVVAVICSEADDVIARDVTGAKETDDCGPGMVDGSASSASRD